MAPPGEQRQQNVDNRRTPLQGADPQVPAVGEAEATAVDQVTIDWPSGRLYHALGLEIPLYTPIFVMSRITGWAAHVIEQLGKNRLIRPRGKYIGSDLRSVTPLRSLKALLQLSG